MQLSHIFAFFTFSCAFRFSTGFRTKAKQLHHIEASRAHNEASQVPCGQSPSWGDVSPTRVAIVLRGETFRYNATTDQSASWRELKDGDVPALQGEFGSSQQMVATKSQLENLIKPLEDAGLQVDVFSATYSTAWHKQHMEEFGARLKGDVLVRRSGSTQSSNLLEAMDAVARYAKEQKFWYSDVYILRHDMLLKQDTFALAKGKPGKILFAFKAKTKPNHRPDGSEYQPKNHVSDLMFFTPGKFFGCLDAVVREHRDNIWNSDLNKNHQEIWDALAPLVGGDAHLGTLVDGEYWCNPRKYAPDEDAAAIANPVYDFPGRERSSHGQVGSTLPGGKAPQVGLDQSSTKAYFLLGFILTAVLVSWGVFGSGGKMYSLLACGVYLIVSVSIDVSISIQKSKTGEYALDPMCAVCLVELVKLIASLGMHSYNCWSSATKFVPDRLSVEDAKWLLFPSLGYTANNLLVWYAIGQNDLATFGIFRDTMVFWTAAIWFFTFWVPLGRMRMLGLGLILLGVVLSEVAKVAAGFTLHLAALWVLLMTLTNAVSSVVNEKALKRNFGLDLNVQNSIMYSMMTVISLIVIVFSKPGKILSLIEFFDGFSVYTILTICLQAGAGLLVSRLLKYADATMKTVATCLRGPALVLLTTAPPITISSAMIVMIGCMIYLFQGPLKVPEVEDPAQKLKECFAKTQANTVEDASEASAEESRVKA